MESIRGGHAEIQGFYVCLMLTVFVVIAQGFTIQVVGAVPLGLNYLVSMSFDRALRV